MDIIYELILTIFLEYIMDVSSNRKIMLWVRIPLLILLIVFFGAILLSLTIVGLELIKNKEVYTGCIFIFIALLFVIWIIKLVKDAYRRIEKK